MQNPNLFEEIKIIDTQEINFSVWVQPSNQKPKYILLNKYDKDMKIFKNLFLFEAKNEDNLFHILYQEKYLTNLKSKNFPYFDPKNLPSKSLNNFWTTPFDPKSNEVKIISKTIFDLFATISKDVRNIENYMPISTHIKNGFGLFKNQKSINYVFAPNHNLKINSKTQRPTRIKDLIDYTKFFESKFYKDYVLSPDEERLIFNMIELDPVFIFEINENGEGSLFISDNEKAKTKNHYGNFETIKRGTFLNTENYYYFKLSEEETKNLFLKNEYDSKIFLENYFWNKINETLNDPFICMEHNNLEDKPVTWTKGSKEKLKRIFQNICWSKNKNPDTYPIKIMIYTKSEQDNFIIFNSYQVEDQEGYTEEYKKLIKGKFLVEGYNYIAHHDQIGFKKSHFKQERILLSFDIDKPNRHNILDSKIFIKKVMDQNND